MPFEQLVEEIVKVPRPLRMSLTFGVQILQRSLDILDLLCTNSKVISYAENDLLFIIELFHSLK